MHSSILGIVPQNEFVAKSLSEDIKTENSLIDSVCHGNESETQEMMKWFLTYLTYRNEDYIDVDVFNSSFTLKKGYKARWFKDVWDKLRDYVDSDKEFKEFMCSDWYINDILGKNGGFLVASENGEFTYCFIDWLRGAQENIEYKIYDVLDYHC